LVPEALGAPGLGPWPEHQRSASCAVQPGQPPPPRPPPRRSQNENGPAGLSAGPL